MSTWQQQYPGQGAPPPAGFQIPNSGFFHPSGYDQQGYQPGYPPQPGYPQPGYPQQPGYPPQGFPTAPPPAAFMPRPAMDDYESADFGGSGFSDQVVRRGFIKKVYSILMVQLLVTMAFVSLFVFHDGTKRYARENTYMYYVGFVALLIVSIVLACCGDVRRRFPINMILLGVYTLVQSFMLGFITAHFQASEVMMALGVTAAVCLGLTLFAFQTKWDFTVLGGGLVACLIIFMIFGLIAMILPGSRTVRLVYAALGVLLFSVYLVYDTQLMMGGKHKYSTSPEEYVFAALNLYIDIVQIFIYILSIFGNSRD